MIDEIYSKMKSKLDTGGYVFWYRVVDNMVKLLSKGDDRKEAEINLLNRINNNQKYIGETFYEVVLKLTSVKNLGKPLIKGIVSINVDAYMLSKKYKLIDNTINMSKTVWVPLDQCKKFKIGDIKKVISVVDHRLVDFSPLSTTTINDVKKF